MLVETFRDQATVQQSELHAGKQAKGVKRGSTFQGKSAFVQAMQRSDRPDRNFNIFPVRNHAGQIDMHHPDNVRARYGREDIRASWFWVAVDLGLFLALVLALRSHLAQSSRTTVTFSSGVCMLQLDSVLGLVPRLAWV